MSDEKPLLVLLSEACQKHRGKHHKNHSSISFSFDDERQQSKSCQDDLQVLKALLPKVEAQAARSADIAHLCDFYKLVLEGGFCPHAAQIFRWGDSGADLFQRALCLLEHQTSKRIMQASLKSHALTQKIASTVAHLLSFEVSLRQTILRDLLHFCFDLGIIQESNLLQNTDTTVQVDLFRETVGTTFEYPLAIPNTETCYALQAIALQVVHDFLSRHRRRVLDDVNSSNATRGDDDVAQVKVVGRFADSLFENIGSGDLVSNLIPSIRQVLLCTVPQQNQKQKTFALRAKICALELLRELVLDQVGNNEVVFLVITTCRWYFESFDDLSNTRETMGKYLVELVHALMVPPMTTSKDLDCCCPALLRDPLVLVLLLDCIGTIKSAVLCDGSGSSKKLCSLVLRVVETMMETTPALLETMTHYCTTNGIFPKLFELLGYDTAPKGIVISLLQRCIESNGRQHTFAKLATTGCQRSANQTEGATRNLVKVTTPNQATINQTSRKRSRTSTTGHSPRKLQLEPSPKRARPQVVLEPEAATSIASDIDPITDSTNMPLNPVSLIDSCHVFVQKAARNARQLVGLCQQEPCALDLTDDPLLLGQLSECFSAIFFLLPLLFTDPIPQWVVSPASILFDSLAEVSMVLQNAWHSGQCPLERLNALTEIIVNVGLASHYGFLEGKKDISLDTDFESITGRFLGECSKCAWEAMLCYPTEASKTSSDIHPLRDLCSECSSKMQRFNLRETICRPCKCSSSRADIQSIITSMPRSMKLVAYAVARPGMAEMSPTKIDGAQIGRICKPGLEKCEELLQRLATTASGIESELLALLPSIVISLTHEVFKRMQAKRVVQKEAITIDEVYRAVCALFPFEKLCWILQNPSTSARLRKATFTSIQNYRSLLRYIGWKNSDLVVDVACQLGYISTMGFVESDTLCDEPHKSFMDIDRSLRLSLLSTTCEGEEKLLPSYRVQKWKIMKEAVFQTTPSELRSLPLVQSECMETTTATSQKIPVVLANMISAPFADTNYGVRLILSRELGSLLMGQNGLVLLSIFGTSERDGAKVDIYDNVTVQTIVSCFFQEIDRLLFNYSCLPQSQLSSTFGTASVCENKRNGEELAAQYQYTALRAIASLCQFANCGNPLGRVVFVHALLRLVRFWASFDQGIDESELESSLAALSFSEIRRLASIRSFSMLASAEFQRALLPALYSEVMLPAASSLFTEAGGKQFNRDGRQRQNSILHAFLNYFILSVSEGVPYGERRENDKHFYLLQSSVSTETLANFVDESLRFVIPSMIIDKDYESLRLVAGFKLFVLSIHSSSESSSGSVRDSRVGFSIRTLTSRAFGTMKSKYSLEEQTKSLCLRPDLLEFILPRLLIGNTDRSQWSFFLNDVLQKTTTLNRMITSSDKKILKGIIWELGGFSHVGQQSIQAVKMAALSRARSAQENSDHNISISDVHKPDAQRIASKWVSSNFMFLLVNIVQQKWQEKTIEDKIRALRSLKLMLNFLHPAEAPQFLTQVVGTVSMATSEEIATEELESTGEKVWLLRSLAAQNLATYTEMLLAVHIDTIGQNLATIVVSLFPVLVLSESHITTPEEIRLRTEAGKVAAGVLEVFTAGQVGKELSDYFKEVPFLPSTPLLDKVRVNLKANGVDFDRLLVLSTTQTTQRVLSGRDSLTSDGGTRGKEDDLPAFSEKLLVALQTRLRIVRPLLSHQSASVRHVTLQHVIDLLRANRALLYRLIEKEDPASNATILTVQYVNNEDYECRGTVTALIEALLTRASVEGNRDVRCSLATCLGEIAAIDPHRLGTISTTSNGKNETGSNAPADDRAWQLAQPPWHSSTRIYALRLVTKHLVNALKAASNSEEQHKVAHSIQQLLLILDKTARDGSEIDSFGSVNVRTLEGVRPVTGDKSLMSPWLSENLEREGVLGIIEPYWLSSFSEKDNNASRQPKSPPFYRSAENYFMWISRWCRYMILRSYQSSTCMWRSLLYACNTAVRSPAGIVVSEFILPLLVIERLCFGSPEDETVILSELQDVFDLTSQPSADSPACMSSSERQKAIKTAFLLVDTFKLWSDREAEGFFKRNTKDDKKRAKVTTMLGFKDGSWNPTLSSERIGDFVEALSLEQMSKAAAATGMHGQALMCLEAKARLALVGPVFDSPKAQAISSSDGKHPMQVTARYGLGRGLLEAIDLSLLKEVLGNLDDYSTMKAVMGNSSSVLEGEDSIREKESRGDWAGALNDYERSLQSQLDTETRSRLEHNSLRCLLQMRQYESVLNQVNGIIYRTKLLSKEAERQCVSRSIPMAVDAAWRLGRWSALDGLIAEYGSTTEVARPAADFQLAVGKAMLGLHRRAKVEVDDSLRVAREAAMSTLATFARDSYDRAYPSLIQLQCIREIEDASILLCEQSLVAADALRSLSEVASSFDSGGWAWDCRLEVASNIDSAPVMDVRLALARLAHDARLERDLFFTMGKKARKNDLLNIASTCLAQSRRVYEVSMASDHNAEQLSFKWIGDVQMQLAKLEYQTGQSGAALRILGVEDVKGWSRLSENEVKMQAAARLQVITGRQTSHSDVRVLEDVAKRLLKTTRWIAEGGLLAVPDVMERFRVTNQLRPKWEKSHFEFGKYLDSLLEARISGVAHHEGWSAEDDSARHYALAEDMNCQKYLLLAMEQYLEALKVNDKHVYQALPRLLSLWFEYTSVDRSTSRKVKTKRQGSEDTPLKSSSDPNAFLRNKQDEANQLFATAAAKISSSTFYAATPQLISRICHPNGNTAQTVQTLLTRVLSKFPGQAMWALAWVRNSLDKTRYTIGNQIFFNAQKSIMGWSNDKRLDPRRKKLLEKNRNVLIASKGFVMYLINIAKYLPKDERSRGFKLTKWRGEVELCDFIPPVQTALLVPVDTTREKDPFPRFRAVHSSVQIMSSKAKPKRVRFYVVGGSSKGLTNPGVDTSASKADLGELHFLVKNEAKGDLRKDARVQDLNNVINRLLGSARKRKRQRRLHLRTFAVTCLSEDCGIVEWVPNTESFRSLTAKAYNPQAATYSPKRRGKRIGNFADASLKKNFEHCQNFFFKNGDLTEAASLFEKYFLNTFPPLFYWWFVQNFMDPHAWYEARTHFTSSAAVWSAVGHVIGLGDRHSENLLIDTSNGGCVHVDFDCIFDKGLTLPKPEIIPFRLTPNMVDAFGPVGADGIYTDSLKTSMSVLRDNRDTLLSVLEPFLKDPIIDWKKSKGRQGNSDTGVRDTKQARRSMKVIDERLRGIYNLRNPNFKKIQRTDQVDVDHDEDMTRMIPLSVEGQVQKMISEATSHENLVQLYIGWMPWI